MSSSHHEEEEEEEAPTKERNKRRRKENNNRFGKLGIKCPTTHPFSFLALQFSKLTYLPPTCHLPPTSYVCVFTTPANNQPQSHSATRNCRHAYVPSLRLHGLQLSLMPITALPLCLLPPSGPPDSARVCLSLAPSLLFPRLFRFCHVSFVPDAPFALHKLFNNFADRDLKQGISVVIETYIGSCRSSRACFLLS